MCSDGFTAVLPFRNEPHPLSVDEISVGELFTGGFSGWSQVVKRLQKHAVPIRHLWGLDRNPVATEAFVRSYGDHVIFHEGEQGWSWLSDIHDTGRNPPLFFQCGIEELWWMTFVSSEWVQILCASSPCPPWSMADLAPGFNREDGLILVHLVTALAILRPRVAVIENVSGMKSHAQWEVVVQLFAWAFYKLKWVAVLDLSEQIPQKRDRLLLVAVDSLAHDLESCDCQSWPISVAPSLRSYHAIVDHDDEWEQSTRLSRDELRLYLSPESLPKGITGGKMSKRQKLDVTQYRLRTLDDVAGTFMTSYGFGMQLDEALISCGGIYGTLFSQGNIVRKFSIIEIAIMQGVCEPIWLPNDLKQATFLLGNAIAVPHAAIGLLNALMLVAPDTLDFDLGASFAKVCSPHMDASNIAICSEGSGFLLDYKQKEDLEVTQPMRELTKVKIVSEVDTYSLLVEVGVHTCALLRFLNGKSLPARIFVRHDTFPDVAFPLAENAKVTFAPLTISVNVPSELMIPAEALVKFDETHPWVVMLHSGGICVLRMPAFPTVGDVYDAIHQVADLNDLEIVLVNAMGQKLLKDDLVVSCVFAVTHAQRTCEVDIHMLDLKVVRDEMSFTFAGLSDDLMSFICMLNDMAMIDIIRCLGWHIVEPLRLPKSDEQAYHVLMFTKAPCRLAVAIGDLQYLLISAVFRNLILNHQEVKQLERILVRIKCLDGQVIAVFLNHDTTFDVLVSYWRKSSKLFDWPEDIRCVVHGKTIDTSTSVGSHMWAVSNKSKGIAVHLVLPLRGGGGSKGTAKHNDAQIPVKNAIAGLLLSMGCDLHLTSTFVDKVMSAVGHVTLQQILKLQNDALKWDALMKLSKSMNIEIPNPDKAASKRFQQVQSRVSDAKITTPPIQACDFVIKENFFSCVDGSQCKQIDCPAAGASGIALMNPQQALPWLEANKKISADELGALVLGRCPLTNDKRCRPVNIPGFDSCGRPVVLATCLHDLGEKQVQITKEKVGKVEVSDTVVLAITVVREEMLDSKWKEVLDSPVRSALEILTQSGCDTNLHVPPWGRSWMSCSSKGKVKPTEADTMQFHIRVVSSQCHLYLKASGQQGIYVTAKDDKHEIDKSYRVVWLDSSLDQIRVEAASCSNNMGLVRLVKNAGKRISRGIRFLNDHFDDAFQQLKPGVDTPAFLTIRHWAKLAPTPPGATYADVAAWIKAMSWPAKPIRPVGGSAWIIGASEKFSECFGTWNESIMLVHWLPPRHEKPQAVVLAGNVTNKAPVQQKPVDDLIDPWANWKSKALPPSSAVMSSNGKAATCAAAPRTLEGPTEERFRKHDEQLVALHQSVKQMNEQLQKQQSRQEAMQTTVDAEFVAVRNEVGMQCQKLEQSFSETLAHALSKQDKQMTDNFRELKAFLMETPLPAKKAKTAKPPESESHEL